MTRVAVYAGSFDPPTNGHLWMVEQGSLLFDKVIVGVGTNPDKQSSFSEEERVSLLERITKGMGDVQVLPFPRQYLVDFAREHEASYLLRGIRNEADYAYERTMRNVNHDLAPGVTSVFLMPDRGLAEVSSSFVKGMVGPAGWEQVVGGFVPSHVHNALLRRYDGFFDRWSSLWQGLGASGDPRPSYDALVAAYADTSRAYHSLTHLSSLFEEFDRVREKLHDPLAVEAAIWFHDAVYDVFSSVNEERSASLAAEVLSGAGVREEAVSRVSSLVLETAHQSSPADKDAAYLVDIDLSVLGAPAPRYQAYERLIREEYEPVIAQEGREAFDRRRMLLLKRFLLREDRLFNTRYFKDLYGGRVAENVEWSLSRLEHPQDL